MAPDRSRSPASWRRAAAHPRRLPRETTDRRGREGRAVPPPREVASARGLLRNVLAELLQRGTLKARDMHLADAEPLGDLRLRHLLVEPHGHDCALTRRQVLHRALENVAHLHPLELGAAAADLPR